MNTILFLSGKTMGDSLGSIGRALGPLFEEQGFEFIELVPSQPGSTDILNQIIKEKKLDFVFSFAGMGADYKAANDRNLWEVLGIPFLAIHGDSPAYFFDRHVHASPYVAVVYGFHEHYNFRKQLPKINGVLAIAEPLPLNQFALEDIDFKKKESGKLFFLKNGNDPEKLRRMWGRDLPPRIASGLFALADELDNEIASDLGLDLNGFVSGFFGGKGIDIDQVPKLHLFYVAQLDDYLRRIKSTMMAEVLKEFPVEIHGYNWEHIDFHGSKCHYVKGADYSLSTGLIKDSLGMIDMSPNTGSNFHDRPLRAFGAYTLCLTNEQACFQQVFENHADFSFRFERESLREKVADVLAHPQRYVEIGRNTALDFQQKFKVEASIRRLCEIADAVRIGAATRQVDMQDFFLWPPVSLT